MRISNGPQRENEVIIECTKEELETMRVAVLTVALMKESSPMRSKRHYDLYNEIFKQSIFADSRKAGWEVDQ